MPPENHSPARPTIAPDINSQSALLGWLKRQAPTLLACILLARFDRPVGAWLLFWPALWGLILAHAGAPPVGLVLAFAAGALLTRGAGCTINDILDRNFDGAVARTATRPLPAGLISVRGAWLWLALQLAAALLLLLSLPAALWPWAFVIVPFIVLYPLLKRISWWPQVWLGFTFNWGLWLGYASQADMAPASGAPFSAFLLCYLGAVLWTVGYDTLYATQDMADDERIGVRSSARRLGQAARTAVKIFYTLAMLCWLAAAAMAALSPVALFGFVLAGLLLCWQFRYWQHGYTSTTSAARQAFLLNIKVGAAIALGLWLGYAM